MAGRLMACSHQAVDERVALEERELPQGKLPVEGLGHCAQRLVVGIGVRSREDAGAPGE